MKTRMGWVLAVATVLVAGGAMAGEGGEGKPPHKPMSPEERFAKMDTDSSGSVTLEEFKAAHQEWARKRAERRGPGAGAEVSAEKRSEKWGARFVALDTNGDETLSQEEFVAGAPKPGEGRQRGPKGPKGQGRGAPEAGEGDGEAAAE